MLQALDASTPLTFLGFDLLRIKAACLSRQTIKEFSWTAKLFEPYRYKIITGGRGSAKSYRVADALILATCTRENCLIGLR
jgi:hypothetical protein